MAAISSRPVADTVFAFDLQRIWGGAYAIGLACAVVGYPLVSAALTATDLYASDRVLVFRIFALALACVCLLISFTKRRAWPVAVVAPVLLFWAALIIRFIWDASLVRVPMELPWQDYAMVTLGVAFVPALGLAAAPDSRSLRIACQAVQLMGLAAGLFIAASAVAVLQDLSKIDRLGFEALNPITIGHLGVSLIIVSMVHRPKGQGLTGLLGTMADSRLVRFLGVAMGGALALLSASKGPILALLFVLLLAQIAKISRAGVRRSIPGLLRFAGVAAVVAIVTWWNFDLVEKLSFGSRLLNSMGEQSTSIRVEMMAGALQQFERAPWLGSAFVEFAQRFYPHNIIAEVLMTTGVVGFLLLFATLVATGRCAWRLLRTDFTWLTLLFAQSFVAAMVSGSLYFDGFFWSLLLAVCGADRLVRGGAAQSRSSSAAQLPAAHS